MLGFLGDICMLCGLAFLVVKRHTINLRGRK